MSFILEKDIIADSWCDEEQSRSKSIIQGGANTVNQPFRGGERPSTDAMRRITETQQTRQFGHSDSHVLARFWGTN